MSFCFSYNVMKQDVYVKIIFEDIFILEVKNVSKQDAIASL